MTRKGSDMKLNRIFTLLCIAAVAGLAQEKVDLATLHKIKDEAFQHSQVMETMFYLTDVNGPRVTNSPGCSSKSASNWNGWGCNRILRPFFRSSPERRSTSNWSKPMRPGVRGTASIFDRESRSCGNLE